MREDEVGDDEVGDHRDEAPCHPLEEGDVNVRDGIEEAEHDEVRRGADRGEDAADRAGVSRHEHESCGVFVFVQIDLTAGVCEHILDGCQ